MASAEEVTRILVCGILTGLPLTLGLLVTPPQNTTAIINNQTKFICRVDNPQNFFEWKQYVTTSVGEVIFAYPPTGQPLDPRYEIEDTYDLIIKSVALSDGGQYGCSTFDMPSQAIASLVILDIPTILMSDLIENRTTEVSCSARYGALRPADLSDLHRPTIHLFVEGREQNIVSELTPGHPPQDGANFQASILSTHFNYTPKISDEGRELRCEIRTNTPAASASMVSVVQVRFGVRNIKLSSRLEIYKVGDEINCTAEGNPEPEINWSPITSPYPYIPTGNTLFLLDSMIGDNTWKCMAKNTVEVTESIETEITFVIEAGYTSATAPFRQSLSLVIITAIVSSVSDMTLFY